MTTTETDERTENAAAGEPHPLAHQTTPLPDELPPETTASTATDGPPEHPAPGPQLSKNELKRQLKRQAMLAQRPAKRAAERARRKANKLEAKQTLLAAQEPSDHQPGSCLQPGSPVDDHLDPAYKRQKTSHAGPAPTRNQQSAQVVFPATVLFDCSFDHRMSDKEIVSLDRQLSASYSVNRRASHRFSNLLCSSFNGRLRTRFETNGSQHTRWKSFSFTDSPLSSLLLPSDPTGASAEHAAPQQPPPGPGSPLSRLERSKVVYLTADSPNVLTTIEPSSVYVIGALVDHNRYKNLCLDLAQQTGISHAQLPISEHMAELKTRKVLTVNQVVEILVTWLAERDWRVALERVMPQRKLAPSGQSSSVDLTREKEQEQELDSVQHDCRGEEPV